MTKHAPLDNAEKELLAKLLARHIENEKAAVAVPEPESPHPSDEQIAAEAGAQSSVNDEELSGKPVPLTPEQAGVTQPSQLSAVNDPAPDLSAVTGNLNALEARLSEIEKNIVLISTVLRGMLLALKDAA